MDVSQRATPEIDATNCSLGRLAQASCSACADACPRKALTVDDDALALEPGLCSSCGACAAACPQGAVRLGGREAPSVEARRRTEVGLVCPRVDPAGGICLQALGLTALADLWLGGTRRILCQTGDCSLCPDGVGLDLAAQVGRLNALLRSRALPELTCETRRVLPRGLPLIEPGEGAVNPARRWLLGVGTKPAARRRPLARLQSLGDRPAEISAFVPRIDPLRCTGCDACIRVCPEHALSLIKDAKGEMIYRTSFSACTGCEMCVDVCGEGAVMVRHQSARSPDVPLFAFQCRGCGVEVHLPAAQPGTGDGLCPVCRRTGHHRRLFQVIG